MTTVWFIRHGESEANIGLPTIDPALVSLTSRGRRQAEQVAQAFVLHPPSIIVVSSFLRAQQTAEPLIYRYSQVPCIREPLVREFELVREFTYLSLSKHKKTTRQERRPLVDAYWERLDPHHVDGEGAESFVQFIHRVSEVITWFKQSRDGFIAVFSHEQFILAVCWLLMSIPGKIDSGCMRRFRSFLDAFSLPNGAIMEMQFSANDEQEMPFTRIRTSHLVL